ncbi:MFS transporter [Saccharopolyspora aridisoli]|uniref:MFS transporter n=1 Tax=Saccharopolyspora aridisoli TaxID=2530385 RepID=A0A4R4UTD8_9PSEU|nr:MFS transporter [Saccharopolyspora aridisoli]TDC93706.1 MFS transporter [Saccharopolyspora aridisoli]
MTTELARPGPASERGLSRSGSFWFIGGIYALFLMASTAPSPMYSIYQQRWGFTNTVLTEVFASYAVAILVALLLCGSLSDHVGRRPVLIGALVVEIAAVLVLALASGVGGLFAGRVLQGLATGAATSAISGALLDFQRPGSSQGSLVNGVAAALGMAGGSLLSGILVQFAPGPTLTSYLLLATGFAVAIPVVLAMPETVAKNSSFGEALRPRRPVVPAGQSARFALMSTMVLASWIVGGMFMSLAPSVAKGMVHDLPNLISGLPVAVLAGFGGLTQLLLARWPAERAVRAGAVLMITAMAGVAAAVLSQHAFLFFVATAVLGVGWGLMFMGAFRMLTGLAAPHQRAGTAAMIYVVAYLSATVPAVVLGYISTITDLTTATLVFTAAASSFAAIAALSTLRR